MQSPVRGRGSHLGVGAGSVAFSSSLGADTKDTHALFGMLLLDKDMEPLVDWCVHAKGQGTLKGCCQKP